MKMPKEQVERIAALGYTESEARFLYIVATHSGYFTMRHFNVFTGVQRGKRSMAFATKQGGVFMVTDLKVFTGRGSQAELPDQNYESNSRNELQNEQFSLTPILCGARDHLLMKHTETG
jgi:hypothetical protein